MSPAGYCGMQEGMKGEKDGEEIATIEVVVTNFKFGSGRAGLSNVLQRCEWLFAGPQLQAARRDRLWCPRSARQPSNHRKPAPAAPRPTITLTSFLCWR